MALLEFKDVVRSFPDGKRDITVLAGVSFEVDEGDFVGVWGTRGSGKSTLLSIAAGLEAADGGIVRVAGRDLTCLSSDERAEWLRGRVGLACADWGPHRHLPVVDYVATPLLCDGRMSPRMAKAKARPVLGQVGLAGCADGSTDALSLSELVRVELACALVRDPLLLLVDEPPVLRSPSESKALYGLLKSLGGKPGLAVVVASEDLELVQKAQRIMSIGGGQVRGMDQPGVVVPLWGRHSEGGGRSA